MDIMNYVITHWDSVLLVLLVVGVLSILYIKGQRGVVNKILYALVTEAEKQFGGGTGELKQAYVIKQVYNALPGILKAIISAERLGDWVDKGLDLAKKKWAENSNVEGYIEKGKTE